MWNKPSAEELSAVPRLYETEDVPCINKIIHLHFFMGSTDLYVAEFDGEDRFFGFVILKGDRQNAEWGYFSLKEIERIRVHGIEFDRDLFWEKRPANEVEEITLCSLGK